MFRWRKYRPNDGERSILVPDYFESTAHEDQKRSNLSQTPIWIGAISQAVMLIVVLFGYLYTVRPVFQHQLLQEQLASVELDRAEVEKQIKNLQYEKNEVESSLYKVRNQIDAVGAEREKLEDELRKASARTVRAQNDASRLEGIVQKQLGEIKGARWELFMIDFTFAHMNTRLKNSSRDLSGYERFPEYLQRYRDEWPDPFKLLKSSIVGLRDRRTSEPRYPESYINEFSEFIETRKGDLTCVNPPYDDLENDFRERSFEIEQIVKYKTDEYINNLVSEYRERGEQVRITDEFRAKTASSYRLTEEFNLEDELRSKVKKYLDSCRSSEQNVVTKFRRLKGVTS